jgi:hypothetical protein
MKKFFKALALVLALTLVIGSIPVSAATATIGIKKNRKSWVVFLGGAQGKKADGTQAGRKRSYKISKLVDGFDAETMDIKLSSENKEIVTTSNKKDKVYGQKMGSAKVNIHVYDIESEKLIGSTSILIKVKKNASEVNYYVADAEGNLVDTSKKLGVNVPYTLVLTRFDADGNKTDTDYRRLTCEDASVTIEADEAYKAHTKYTVTFTKSGEFTLIGGAYQSEAYNANIVEAEIKLTAGYDAVAVKQSGLASADVTFETEVTGLTADVFKAYYLVGETKIYPSAAQKVTCKDNVATVEFLSNFIQGYEYFVEYDGTLAGSFKADTITADSVVAIEIPAQQIEAGAANCKLEYKLLNENGIDIKSLLGSTLNGVLSFEIVNGDIDTYVTSGNEPVIYIGTANKSYVVKATYTWINSNGDTKTAEGQGNVASVTPAVWEIGTVTGVITLGNKDLIKADGTLDGDVKTQTWTLDDATSKASIQIAVPYTKNGKTVYEGFNVDAEPSIYARYTAKSADESVVMLATAAPDGQRWALTANKAGSTTIIIYGVDSNNKETVIGAVPVEVKAKREAKTITVTPSKNTLNEGYILDYVEFKVVVKDQYDEEMKGLTYTVTNANKNDGTAGPVLAVDGATELTGKSFYLYGDDVTTKTGVLNVKFTCGNLSQTVYINCGDEAEAKTYVLKLKSSVDGSDKNTLDTSIKQDTEWTWIYVQLEGRSQSGYNAPSKWATFVEATPKSEQTASGAALGIKYVFTVTKDSKVLKASDLGDAWDGDFNAAAPYGVSGSAVKFAKGTYTVTAYKVETKADNVIVSVVGQQVLTIEDKQIMPTVTKKDNAEKLSGLTAADIASAFDVKFNGSADGIKVEFNFTVDGEGKTAYVKEAYVTILNSNVGNYTITVNVDTLVKTAN